MTLAAFKAWAQDAAVRAVKTFAQSLVALIGAGATGFLSVSWQTDLGIAGVAAVVSVLHNVATLPGATDDTAK